MQQEFIFEHKVYRIRRQLDLNSRSEEPILFRDLNSAQGFFRTAAENRFICPCNYTQKCIRYSNDRDSKSYKRNRRELRDFGKELGMRLIRYAKIVIGSIGPILLISLLILQYAVANNDIEYKYDIIQKALGDLPQPENSEGNRAYFEKVFQVFSKTLESDDKETKALLNRWNSYLISVSHYSNDDYQKAIKSQQLDYFNAIIKLNKRIEETSNFRKEYSSSWVDDMIGKFGKEYAKKNRDAILDNFGAIIARSYRQYENELQNLVYVESMLYGSYKDYFGTFLDFYNEKLDEHGREKLIPRKEAAVAFLELIQDVSFTHMYQTCVLRDKMAENKAKKINKDLFQFFKDQKVSQNFDISKASDDLDAAIQND